MKLNNACGVLHSNPDTVCEWSCISKPKIVLTGIWEISTIPFCAEQPIHVCLFVFSSVKLG